MVHSRKFQRYRYTHIYFYICFFLIIISIVPLLVVMPIFPALCFSLIALVTDSYTGNVKHKYLLLYSVILSYLSSKSIFSDNFC
jgi:hypothetical protein